VAANINLAVKTVSAWWSAQLFSCWVDLYADRQPWSLWKDEHVDNYSTNNVRRPDSMQLRQENKLGGSVVYDVGLVINRLRVPTPGSALLD